MIENCPNCRQIIKREAWRSFWYGFFHMFGPPRQIDLDAIWEEHENTCVN